MARSIIQAQAASPTFTHVYAALVAVVNTKVNIQWSLASKTHPLDQKESTQ